MLPFIIAVFFMTLTIHIEWEPISLFTVLLRGLGALK